MVPREARFPPAAQCALIWTVHVVESDAQLVARCREGDDDAWRELVERFSRYVYAIAVQAFRLPQADAEDGSPESQLELGRAYAMGYVAPRDFATAQGWLDAAAANADADDDTRAAASALLAQVTTLLEAERAQEPAPTLV